MYRYTRTNMIFPHVHNGPRTSQYKSIKNESSHSRLTVPGADLVVETWRQQLRTDTRARPFFLWSIFVDIFLFRNIGRVFRWCTMSGLSFWCVFSLRSWSAVYCSLSHSRPRFALLNSAYGILL